MILNVKPNATKRLKVFIQFPPINLSLFVLMILHFLYSVKYLIALSKF